MNSLLYWNWSHAIYFEHNAQEEHGKFQLKKIYEPNIVFKSNTENCNEYFMCVSRVFQQKKKKLPPRISKFR